MVQDEASGRNVPFSFAKRFITVPPAGVGMSEPAGRLKPDSVPTFCPQLMRIAEHGRD
jgi:hypothetical protein